MNARELISALRALGPQDKNVEYAYIADHLYEMTLNSGARFSDVMQFKLFLHELSEAWRMSDFPEGTRFPESTKVVQMVPESKPAARVTRRMPPCWDEYYVCVRCGHVHEHVFKCGVSIGAGRFCQCEVEVPA